MRIRLFFLLPFFCIAVKGQNAYFDDLLQLKDIIDKYYAPLSLLEQRTKIDFNKEFSALLTENADIQTDNDFVIVVRKVLGLLSDRHAAITNGNTIKLYFNQFPQIANYGSIALNDTLVANAYFALVTDSVYSKVKCGMRIKYMDGYYYNMRPFRSGDKIIQAGEIISEIDGEDISQYINRSRRSFYNAQWDDKNQQWFDDNLLLSMPFLKKEHIILTIGDEKITIQLDKTLEILKKEISAAPQSQAFLINENCLYLQIPKMTNEQWYIQKIEELSNSQISKVILDVRGNRGGSDRVWREVLSHLIPKPLVCNTHIKIVDNPDEKLVGLYNLKETLLEYADTIFPSGKNNGNYPQIYVLQDQFTYSAASSLVSVAFGSKEITSIGEHLTENGGKGLTPLIFCLKNSRLVFRIPFTVDLSGGEENPYMNRVEVEVKSNITDHINRRFNEDVYSKEYILYKDRLVDYILKEI